MRRMLLILNLSIKNVYVGMGISKDNIELQCQSSILPMHERGPSPNGR